jgi:hypothetical protein
MILILSAGDDAHVTEVVARLERRGVPTLVFAHRDLAGDAELSVRLGRDGATRLRLRSSRYDVELTDVRAAWVRRPGLITRGVEDAVTAARVDQCANLLQDAWSLLRCRWIPGPFAQLATLDRQKLTQLALAARLGFEIPATCAGNDPDEVLELHEEHAGNLVSKLLWPQTGRAEQGVRYTEVVTRRDLAHVERIRDCPIAFQENVPKALELRVTVVGERVFCAAVHSQATCQTRDDWRKYDDHATPHTAHELPADVAARCVALARALGLSYGALDLVLTPDGRHVFLEINPNGQYLWIEKETGLPIGAAVCEWLIAADREDRA